MYVSLLIKIRRLIVICYIDLNKVIFVKEGKNLIYIYTTLRLLFNQCYFVLLYYIYTYLCDYVISLHIFCLLPNIVRNR